MIERQPMVAIVVLKSEQFDELVPKRALLGNEFVEVENHAKSIVGKLSKGNTDTSKNLCS